MQTGNKSYSCVQCNLSFKMTKDLKTHMLQYDVKKPHGCIQCGYSTISASKLITHKLVHSGENLLFTHTAAIPAQQLAASRGTC